MSCYYKAGQGNVCDEQVIIATAPDDHFPVVALIVGLVVLVFLIVVIARYCYGVATRTDRSRVGFVWLSIFFPGLALAICLVLDKDDSRYSPQEKEKHKLK